MTFNERRNTWFSKTFEKDMRFFNLFKWKKIYRFDENGYDKDGYDKDGYDKDGYDKDGYDKDGYDKEGYNRDGYDKSGYDKNGYNHRGNDKDGFDKDGYDLNGYDKYGWNRNGYNYYGYDKSGYDKDGYNGYGYDKSGYDKDGYNLRGYDKNGYSKDGYNLHGYDREGYDKDGYDLNGYDRNGRNRNGFNYYGYDKDGYDKDGYDKNGYDKDGYDKNGLDRAGCPKSNIQNISQHDSFTAHHSETSNGIGKECSELEELYDRYLAGENGVAVKLANCYVYGRGTARDYKKALRILLDSAIEYYDLEAIRELADHFLIGDIVEENVDLANYFNKLYDDKKLESVVEYKARPSLELQDSINRGNVTFKEEQEHLSEVIGKLTDTIWYLENYGGDLDNDTSWMDRDQLDDWRDKKADQIENRYEAKRYRRIKNQPYYARMDAIFEGRQETYYIGEEEYWDSDPAYRILSVWSEIGKRYRDYSSTTFYVNEYEYRVKLRRKFDISYGRLLEYYDEYTEGSTASQADITDPYLLRILEEKRNEKNITNIIRSIQLNQNNIIEDDFKANIIVQGCAGSGKTMILLHRLANMKYNQKNYDWTKVKIITPNKEFSLFIDELSRNLKIEEIDRITLSEYYLSVLLKYDNLYPERVINGGRVRLVSHFNLEDEIEKIQDEGNIKKEVIEWIYSENFKNELSIRAFENKKTISNFKEALEVFAMQFSRMMEEHGFKIPKKMLNTNCILYAKTLFMLLVFGAPYNNENLLCIDEGQDISEQQYVLLYEINRKNVCFNIYGDLAQRIPENVSISSWNNIKSMFNASYYELNENYRNSDNIIQFYGRTLNINNASFGLKTKDVECFDVEILDILLKIQLLLGNRVVVISNSEKNIPSNVIDLCNSRKESENRIPIMSVKQVKGLEFDTAFVFDKGMDNNERYISYTRALSELYVFSDFLGSKVSFKLQNEPKGTKC